MEEPRRLSKEVESVMARKAKKVKPMNVVPFRPRVVTAEEMKSVVKPAEGTQSWPERYKRAWFRIYHRLPEWRKKEVDKYPKGDTLPLLSHEQDFARQVIALAESSDPLAM